MTRPYIQHPSESRPPSWCALETCELEIIADVKQCPPYHTVYFTSWIRSLFYYFYFIVLVHGAFNILLLVCVCVGGGITANDDPFFSVHDNKRKSWISMLCQCDASVCVEGVLWQPRSRAGGATIRPQDGAARWCMSCQLAGNKAIV